MVGLKSHAKVNLALDILGKDLETGFRFVESVLCEVPSLYDEIEITDSNELIVETDNEELNKNPEENLAYKAAKFLGITAKIRIKKNIPLRSGLGGGSSNAATVLKVLGEDKTEEELLSVAAKLGMDVPFFILGGVCHAVHYGEQVTRIKTDLKLDPEIQIYGEKKSTKEVYKSLDLSKTGRNRAKTKALIRALEVNNMEGVRKNLHNDFDIQKEEFSLTGSGPTRFSL